MYVRIIRDRAREEGEYGAWDGTVWDGETLVGLVTAETRDALVGKAREKAERYAATESVDETVEL